MSDNCGSISLANTTDGNLAFGASAGTDCVTPGVGGAGNTHASRSGFYHLTRINQKARTFFPSNTWLQGKVTANMNIVATCNASWNGTSLNFYRSGGGCSNTGEIAAVFLHEWGHGMDTNTGGAASETAAAKRSATRSRSWKRATRASARTHRRVSTAPTASAAPACATSATSA